LQQVHHEGAAASSPRRRYSRFRFTTKALQQVQVHYESAGLPRRRWFTTKALQHHESAVAGSAVNSVQKRYNRFNNKFNNNSGSLRKRSKGSKKQQKQQKITNTAKTAKAAKAAKPSTSNPNNQSLFQIISLAWTWSKPANQRTSA